MQFRLLCLQGMTGGTIGGIVVSDLILGATHTIFKRNQPVVFCVLLLVDSLCKLCRACLSASGASCGAAELSWRLPGPQVATTPTPTSSAPRARRP
jgi:hypothetical protein